MANLKNHPGMFLNPAAAASLERMEDEHDAPFLVTSAGRTPALQNNYIYRYFVVGGKYNRPPFLYQPARPAEASPHVANGGEAADIGDANHRQWIKNNGARHGWTFPLAWDIVHAVYNPANDRHKNDTATKIKREQQWLNDNQGEKLVVDGRRGPATAMATRRYQEKLIPWGYKGQLDGIWGDGTQVAHEKYFASLQPKTAPSSNRPMLSRKAKSWGGPVKDLQDRLNGRYPAYSKLKADGIYGAATEKVVKEFQKRSRLKVDGIVGPATWKALGF